ncbi:hypothetical protein BVRB_6g138900 [Beta vulgaris subsp. vulgaris]|nr:hypothetical protein BVRB_6g138900 [Beta vulgaris subsp. vulgaris]
MLQISFITPFSLFLKFAPPFFVAVIKPLRVYSFAAALRRICFLSNSLAGINQP